MYLTKLASLHQLTSDTSLLVNALSGAVDVVDNDLRTDLLQVALGGRPDVADAHRKALIERGYLFADEGAERAALEELYLAYERASGTRPMQFVLCPTYGCNLACSYCFEGSQLHSRPEVMSRQQVEDAFAALRELCSAKPDRPRQVVLFGGEPLLPTTEDAVEAVLTLAAEGDIPVQVVTNGTYLRRFISIFGRYPGVVRGVQVTLDGPREIHDARRRRHDGRGSFAEVADGVEACFEAGIGVNLRVNLDAQNMDCLDEFADLLGDLGWTGRNGFRCQLAPVTDHVGTATWPHLLREDQLVEPVLALWGRRPELREALDFRLFRVLHHLISVIEPQAREKTMPRFHYCEADRGDILTFGPDGLVYVCPESIGEPDNAVGTYSPDLQISPARRRQWEERSVLTLPECRECNIATFCGGGCAYAALRQFGSPCHPVCAGAPDVLRAYVDALRDRSWTGGLPSGDRSTAVAGAPGRHDS